MRAVCRCLQVRRKQSVASPRPPPVECKVALPCQHETWKHVKTQRAYTIVSVAKLQVKYAPLDMVDCAIYALPNDTTLWVRPLRDFVELIDGQPRFVRVEDALSVMLPSFVADVLDPDDEDWQVTNSETTQSNEIQ